MQKSVLSVLAGAVLAIGLAVNVFGAGGGGGGGGSGAEFAPPKSLPIGSVHETAAWAKERLAIVQVYGGSQGPVMSGGTNWAMVMANDPDTRIILDAAGQKVIDYTAVRPEERSYTGANGSDTNWNEYFWGYQEYYLAESNGMWRIPDGGNVVDMMLVDYIFIPCPGVVSAQVSLKDPNTGNQSWYSLNVGYDGFYQLKSLLGIADRGWTGTIMLYGNDGKSAAYDMGSGKQLDGVEVKTTVKAGLHGWKFLDDPGSVYDQPVSTNGVGEVGSYQIKLTKAGTVWFYGRTIEGEEAVSVAIQKVGDDGDPIYIPVKPGQWLPIDLEEGLYHAWLIYPKCGRDNPVWPYQGPVLGAIVHL